MNDSMPNARPNIVVILTDDQGPWAMRCAGNEDIITPHLDRLAAEGTRFDQMYCASPVCSPARASLLTGQIPSQHGVHDWLSGGSMASDAYGTAIQYMDGAPSYTQQLEAAGYICGLSGKWHLGDSLVPQHGFSQWYAHQQGGGPYYNAPMIRDGEAYNEPRYVTDAITDDALEFLDHYAAGEQPFYLSVHYTAPHSPWVDCHPDEFTAMYEECDFASIPRDPENPWGVPGWYPEPESDLWRKQLIGYFAATTAMDANVGRILQNLDETGIADSTIVWFLSDNGFSTGHRGIWGKGNATFPLNMWDNSVRIPAIVRHPGHVPAGVVDTHMVSQYDFSHTLLDQVGLTMPDDQNLPGRSFLANITDGGSEADDAQVVILDEYGPVRMIRTPDWKYTHRYPYGPHELYDMSNDPGETRNLLDDAACEETVVYLRNRLETWYQRYVDPTKDGTREPVTGSGQFDRAGIAREGRPGYEQDQRIDSERRGNIPSFWGAVDDAT